MSILNDAQYSSRLNNYNSSLANNLLSRKRKRPSDSSSSSSRAPEDTTLAPKTRPNIVLQKSASENLLEIRMRRESLLPESSKSSAHVFVVKSINNDKPQSFRILSGIPRAQLPLTFIDNSTTPTRLFSAHLPQLDTDGQTPPRVLLVCDTAQPDGALYAVERVGDRTYALCKLAEWLKLHHVETLAQSRPVMSQKESVMQDGKTPASWWKSVAVDAPGISASAPAPAPAPALPLRKAPRLSVYRPETQAIEAEATPTPVEEAPVEADATVLSAEDVFVKFISQYLDTLYLSKTPLGFFTKGPLSRARAAFTSAQIEGSSLVDLVQFLRTMIHPSSATDKKYRDKLPEILKDIPPQEQDAHDSPAAKKKRRKKRLKPDKNGMLPDEVDYFAKWWYQDDTSAPSDETAEQSLRRRSGQLRTRETFMQTILILEVLSLELLPEFKDRLQAHAEKDEGGSQKPKAKNKKAEQLTLGLELLVDKLCIWHSLDAQDVLESKPEKNVKEGANQLRSFCVEVIIPFYMSRIPEYASIVNKKLGGPSTSTNSKPKSTSSRKPGEAEVRNVQDNKSRRTLQRVATEVTLQTAPKPKRTLGRSATDSQMMLTVKHETPELSLDSIPPRRDSQPATLRRSDSLNKYRLRQREVDFGAIAAANDAKAKKRQEVEQKLKDAISTLKKPSRATVSGEFADVLEQRKRMAQARARPQLHKRTSSSVAQVAATPKHFKSTAPIAATPHHITQPSFVRPAIPSSGPSLIPSSNIKQKSLSFAAFPLLEEDSDDDNDDDAIPATDHRPRHRDALAETPSKPRVGFAPLPAGLLREKCREEYDINTWRVEGERGDESPLRESPSLLRTPSKPSRPWIDETPSKPVSVLGLVKAKGKDVIGLEQEKGKGIPNVVTATPDKGVLQGGVTRVQGQGQASTIYHALGWDDDSND